MSKQHILLCIFTLCFLSSWQNALGAEESSVLINEIAWMGTTTSVNDEWIELKNTTSEIIPLDDWTLNSSNGKLTIKLKGSIKANGFYLLERTDDNSVLDIKADLIYKGALPNDGLDLKLEDSSQNLIDGTNYFGGWPKGDNSTKQTMERVSLEIWQTSQNPNGTPKKTNSPGVQKPLSKESQSLPEVKKTDNKNNSGLATIPISPTAPLSSNNSYIIFFISILVIVLSGGTILFLKFKKNSFIKH